MIGNDCAVEKESEIHAALNRLESSTDTLITVYNKLSEKLAPVLASDAPREDKDKLSSTGETEVGSRITAATQTLQTYTDKLHRLYERTAL